MGGRFLESVAPLGDLHACAAQRCLQIMERDERKAIEEERKAIEIRKITSVFTPYDTDSSGCVSTADFKKAILGEQSDDLSSDDLQEWIEIGLRNCLTEDDRVD